MGLGKKICLIKIYDWLKYLGFFLKICRSEMKKPIFYFSITVVLFFIPGKKSVGQEAEFGRVAFSFNLTRLAVSEVNMSFEYFITSRRSIEFNGGLIYTNDFLAEQSADWVNSFAFSEHGFAGRFHYKIFRRPEVNSKWRDYIAPGLIFKSLYYNDIPIISEVKIDPFDNDTSFKYTESFLQKRERTKIGIEFLWGKVYEASRTFAFEFYYGAGIVVTMSTRTDHDRYATYVSSLGQYRNKSVPDFIDKATYVRPTIQLGIKLRIRT
jgi:hypothetical protein